VRFAWANPGSAVGAHGWMSRPGLNLTAQKNQSHLQDHGKFSAKFRSFSAVSKRNFASKYAFDSIFQNLPDYLAEFFEIRQILQILRKLQKIC